MHVVRVGLKRLVGRHGYRRLATKNAIAENAEPSIAVEINMLCTSPPHVQAMVAVAAYASGTATPATTHRYAHGAISTRTRVNSRALKTVIANALAHEKSVGHSPTVEMKAQTPAVLRYRGSLEGKAVMAPNAEVGWQPEALTQFPVTIVCARASFP